MSKAKGASGGRSQASRRSPAPKPSKYRTANNWRGDLSEIAFVHKAMSLGYPVLRPYGNIHRYDFAVEGGGKLWRMQVKSTSYMVGGNYTLHTRCNTRRGVMAYKECDFDFLVAHVVPEDAWFVLPVSVVAGRSTIVLRPKSTRPKLHFHPDPYAGYGEAMHQFGEPPGPEF